MEKIRMDKTNRSGMYLLWLAALLLAAVLATCKPEVAQDSQPQPTKSFKQRFAELEAQQQRIMYQEYGRE